MSVSSLFRTRSASIAAELESLRHRFARLIYQDAPPERFADLKLAHQILLRRAVHTPQLAAVARDYLSRFNVDMHLLNATMQWATEHRESVRYAEACDSFADPFHRKKSRSLRFIPFHDETKPSYTANDSRTVNVRALSDLQARLLPSGRYGIHMLNPIEAKVNTLEESRIICEEIVSFLPKIDCNVNTYRLAIKMTSRWGNSDMCQELVSQALTRGLTLPVISWCALITAYGRGKRMHDAARVWLRNVKRVEPYKALMTAFGKFGEIDVVWRLYERMKAEGLRPTALIYETVLHFMANGFRPEECIQVLDDMERVDMVPAGAIVVDVVKALGLLHMDRSRRLLQRLEAAHPSQWHLMAVAMTCVYARACVSSEAETLLAQIYARSAKLNVLDACFLISAFAVGGEYDRACAFLLHHKEAMSAASPSHRNAINQAFSDLFEKSRNLADIETALAVALEARIPLMARTINMALRMYRRWHCTVSELDKLEHRLLQSALWPADLYPGLLLASIEANDMKRVLSLLTCNIKNLAMSDRGAYLLRRVRQRLLSSTENSRDDEIRADLYTEILFNVGLELLPSNYVAFAKSCISLRRWSDFQRILNCMERHGLKLPEHIMQSARKKMIEDGIALLDQPKNTDLSLV